MNASTNTLTITPENKIEIAYNSPPWWYDLRGLAILYFGYRDSLFRQIQFFSSNIKGNHLEVAIGSGSLLSLILKIKKIDFNKIIGFDYSARMLSGAKERFDKNAKIELFTADAKRITLPADSFDSVNIANAFHCFPESYESLKEITRVLKPNAILAVNIFLKPNLWNPFNYISIAISRWGIKKGILYKAYTINEVDQIIKQCGLIIIDKKVKGNSYYVKATK